jgi:hypothetical protein
MTSLTRPLIICAVALLACTSIASGVFAASSQLEKTLTGIAAGTAPALLDPIDESGRTGWTCTPEIRARAASRGASALPSTDD